MTRVECERVLKSARVESKGGNQYAVTMISPKGNEIMRAVDMDGITIVSDEDFEKLGKAGMDTDSFYTVDQYSEDLGDDEYHDIATEATANFVLIYSGFDAEKFIANNK